jgi:hypothetical protein
VLVAAQRTSDRHLRLAPTVFACLPFCRDYSARDEARCDCDKLQQVLGSLCLSVCFRCFPASLLTQSHCFVCLSACGLSPRVQGLLCA